MMVRVIADPAVQAAMPEVSTTPHVEVITAKELVSLKPVNVPCADLIAVIEPPYHVYAQH